MTVSALRLIAVGAMMTLIVAVFAAFSASLSIGGVVYSEDPKSCASCHYEKTFYEGWKKSLHGESDVGCVQCHTPAVMDKLTFQKYTRDMTCSNCHSDVEALLEATKFYGYWPIPARIIIEVNPHDELSHFANVPCAACHIEHKLERGERKMVSLNPCIRCHDIAPPPLQP